MTEMGAGTPDIGFGIYVHWPFCLAKCPYCDFNSHVSHQPVDHDRFGRALVRELHHFAVRTPRRTVTSVFFGGGTPSLMPPRVVGAVLDAVGSLWATAHDVEVTLEANPTSAEAGNFAGYRAAGVNRASVGVQALNDADLKALGRQHSAEEALAAYRLAARTFDRTSFDLIYARPGQSVPDWRTELRRALNEQGGHMSLYQLTIEPGTTFAQLHGRGRLQVPDEEVAADLFDVTQELTEAAGLPAYEVSNHAQPEAQCRHNRLYWRYGEYAGVGPGAHGRLVGDDGHRHSVSVERDPRQWLELVETRGHGLVEDEPVTPIEADRERLLMGLRLSEGIRLKEFAAPFNAETVRDLVELELLYQPDQWRLAATAEGRKVLNAVIRTLADE